MPYVPYWWLGLAALALALLFLYFKFFVFDD